MRNEAWIIEPFLTAAKQWASDIIVADQSSTDATLQILRRTPDIDVVQNDSPSYDESYRQRLLLGRARRIVGKRILIGLDADEALSANVSTSDEWRRVDSLKPGTVLRFRWVNVLPGFERAWIPPIPSAFGFVDDGADHVGRTIHSPRVPYPTDAPTFDLEDVVVLHFQYVVWERMLSKHRWYQAWEHVVRKEKTPLEIFRQYRHMHGSWAQDEIQPVRPEWLNGFRNLGIDFGRLAGEAITWWDREVLSMLQQHGPERFRLIDIWDKDWNAVAVAAGLSEARFDDPRTAFEKAAHRALRATQGFRSNLVVRALEKALRSAGW